MAGEALRQEIENGTRRTVEGRECIWYDGYWIRYYPPPKDSWAAKKELIDTLTRRLFHHTEAGINTPGRKLDVAREFYERETDPARRRVNGAMLAGALFNRAADIVSVIVDLETKGIAITPDDALMKICDQCFREALDLGRLVKHYSGHEGIDELWGEPLKAFTMPLEDFYASRYVKIALTMRDIDRIADRTVEVFAPDPAFNGAAPLVREFAEASKREIETLRRDPVNFEVWPRFVAAAEALEAFEPSVESRPPRGRRIAVERGRALLRESKSLLEYIAGARVPMRTSMQALFEDFDAYATARTPPRAESP